ncbi:TolC family protein, partial [Candidatus Poribacteria bacterium]
SEARAAFMPVLSASGSYTFFGELPTIELDFSPESLGLPPELLEAMGGGVDGAQDSGPSEIEMGQEDTYRAGLSLQQPIFAWGKISNNYKQAKLSLEASKQELEAVKQQVILDITTAFYNVLLTEKLVEVGEMAVEQVEAHLRIAQNLLDAGVSTNFDVLRAKVRLANTKSQLIRVQNGLRLAKDNLKNITNIELNTQITAVGELTYYPLDLNLDQLIESAMSNRPELKQLQFRELAGEKFISLAKAGNKPSVALAGNYNYESYADTLGDVFETDEWKKSWSVTLALQVPIFDGLATRARVKQAKSGFRQIQIGREQLSDGIGLEVRAAFFGFQESRELLKEQEETVQQAEESLRIANLRYKNGIITNVELMDAELAFTQAQTNRFNALHDYVIAIARLEKASASELD